MSELPDDATLARLREQLEALREELTELLEMSKSGAKPVSLDEPIGRLSRVDAMQQQAMVKASRGQLEVRLGQVRLALQRMDEDEYGTCRRCDEPIAIARLEARPEAPFCTACQEGIDQSR